MPQYIVVSDPVYKGPAQRPLVPGRDYPRTYREFVEMLPTDEVCAAYLERLRWPGGFICPACETCVPPSRHTRGRLVCRACRYQASVTAGTILGKTRTPLTTWFESASVGARVVASRHQGPLRRAFVDRIAHHYILGHEELTVHPHKKIEVGVLLEGNPLLGQFHVPLHRPP